MKYILTLAIFLFLGSVFIFPSVWKEVPIAKDFIYQSVCDKPINYKIGSIDNRFGLTYSEVKDVASRAAQIWNKVADKNVFLHNPKGKLTINMVYDKRQFLNSQISDLEGKLNTDETSLKSEVESFKKDSQNFEKRLKDFDDKVYYWNSQGGASEAEFEKLKEEQQAIQNEGKSLNERASKLKLTTQDYNDNVSTLNNTIDSFKKELDVRPEEGVYDPNNETISIFLNNNREELTRTVAHELGHARSLPHSEDKSAIMYPSTTASFSLAPDDASFLFEICKERPFYELLLDYISSNLRHAAVK